MTPNFSDKIKELIAKKPLDPEDIQPLKSALKNYAKDYVNLKKGGNSSINLTDTFKNDIVVADANENFIRDIGRQMERTRDYTMYENKKDNGAYEIVVVPLDRSWWEKHSWFLPIITLVLGSTMTFCFTYLNNRLSSQANKQMKMPKKIEVQVTTSHQSDSLTNLKIAIKDSAKY